MTTQQQMDLLERIILFDKRPRTVTLDREASVISFEGGRWRVEGLFDAGTPIEISPERLAVSARPEELVPIVDRIPAPGTPEMEQLKSLMPPQMLTDINNLIHQAQSVLPADPVLRRPSQEDLDSALWRLVDAAGLLSQVATPGAQGTQGHPTGRGFSVSK